MHESQGATPGLRARFSSNDHGDAISRTDLVGFGLIEDGPDPALDEIVRIAARITRCEKAFITFAHNDQLHVIASVGSSVSQTPAALSVCGVTYREDAPLIVPDLSRDNRFKDYPYVAREDGNRFRKQSMCRSFTNCTGMKMVKLPDVTMSMCGRKVTDT
mgnify:CR=1 FL=1